MNAAKRRPYAALTPGVQLLDKGQPHNAQCLLRVISRRFAAPSRMSAFGGKADLIHYGSEGPLIAISGRALVGDNPQRS